MSSIPASRPVPIIAPVERLYRPLAPYAYTGSLDENHLLPTAIGVPKPSALVPILRLPS